MGIMKTTKHIALAFALTALVVLWGVPASAQTRASLVSTDVTVGPPEGGGTVSTFNGFEITPGHSEDADTYGWVCYGRTAGELPGNFTLIANYDTPSDGVTAGLSQAVTG